MDDPTMEESLSSSSIHEGSDDPDYSPSSLDMDTSSNEEQLLVKRSWRKGGGDAVEDDSETSSGCEMPTWLLPAKRQHATTSTHSLDQQQDLATMDTAG